MFDTFILHICLGVVQLYTSKKKKHLEAGNEHVNCLSQNIFFFRTPYFPSITEGHFTFLSLKYLYYRFKWVHDTLSFMAGLFQTVLDRSSLLCFK